MSLKDGRLPIAETYTHFVLFWGIRDRKYLGEGQDAAVPPSTTTHPPCHPGSFDDQLRKTQAEQGIIDL